LKKINSFIKAFFYFFVNIYIDIIKL
jgi:hypothetical protein